LMELKGWLVGTYNDPADDDDDEARRDKIKFCHACKDIITAV
jgi:non-structural maintenance of chromosomes element 1